MQWCSKILRYCVVKKIPIFKYIGIYLEGRRVVVLSDWLNVNLETRKSIDALLVLPVYLHEEFEQRSLK